VLRLVRSGMGAPLACSLPVAELNWKAGCVERHLSGLERGKGCEALPIATPDENGNYSVGSGKSGKNGMARKGMTKRREQFDPLLS
jgi:hypothetical protein